MYIRDLPEGTPLTIHASMGVESLEFPSQILRVEEKYLLLESVRAGEEYDNKIINFRSKVARADIVAYQNQTMFLFRNVTMINFYKEKRPTMVIRSDVWGDKMNRRAAPRFIVNESCTMTSQMNNKSSRCTIKDVSMTGISLISDRALRVGDNLDISFKDKYTNEVINLDARIVRAIKSGNEKQNLYGCKLAQDYQQLNKYIMQIQRSKQKLH